AGDSRLSSDVHLFFQAGDGIRAFHGTGVRTCALPIFIPIINVSFGFGGGGGGATEGGTGTGGGGGARMKVAGVLVIQGDDVRFVQTGAGGALDKLVDAIPDLLEKCQVKA